MVAQVSRESRQYSISRAGVPNGALPEGMWVDLGSGDDGREAMIRSLEIEGWARSPRSGEWWGTILNLLKFSGSSMKGGPRRPGHWPTSRSGPANLPHAVTRTPAPTEGDDGL